MEEGRKGFLLGVAAYGIWGLLPLYWPLLEPASATEVLAHRLLWTALVMVGVVLLLHRWPLLRAALTNRRQLVVLGFASLTISVNWGVYIYGVVSHHVVEASLGYFINPLVTVLAGVLLLGERLRPVQWAALALAGVAVLGLTVDYGRPPWIALALAFSFATYGVLKKRSPVNAIEGLTVETLLLAPAALGYLVLLQQVGAGTLDEGSGHVALLVSAGVTTAVPLLCFGAAAARISLTTLGLLQYLAPTLQFLIGVYLQGEPMPAARWVGFSVIWLALAIFSVDSWRDRQLTRLRVEASAA